MFALTLLYGIERPTMYNYNISRVRAVRSANNVCRSNVSGKKMRQYKFMQCEKELG